MKSAPKLHAVTSVRLQILVSLLLLFAVAPTTAAAANKIPDSAWQTGTLRDVTTDTHSRVVGMINNGHGMVGTQIRIVWHYTIDGNQYAYQADRTTRGRKKPLDVTINAPIKFAVVGMDLYLKDEAGKVHKLAIATKTLKEKNGDGK